MTSDKRMSDKRLNGIREKQNPNGTFGSIIHELIAEIDALRSALAHEISERDRLSLENSELRTALEAERRVEDGDVLSLKVMLDHIVMECGSFSMEAIRSAASRASDLLTRLSAAKEEAERERDEALARAIGTSQQGALANLCGTDAAGLAEMARDAALKVARQYEAERDEARAERDEALAALATARADALEEAAKVCGAVRDGMTGQSHLFGKAEDECSFHIRALKSPAPVNAEHAKEEQ